MKLNQGVLKRVRQVEQKKGINYAKTTGKLFTSLSIIQLIAVIFAVTMNLIYILGMLLVNLESDTIKNVLGSIITVGVCSLILILSLVLKKIKIYLPSLIISSVSCVFLILLFASMMEDLTGFIGLNVSFYWRHFAPLTIVVIMSIWSTVIALRENHLLKLNYCKVEENLYNLYHSTTNDLNEEQWEEFLETYNGESPNQLLKEKNQETEIL